MTNVAVNWFEIPVTDVARAAEFYGTVLNTEIGEMPGPDGPMKILQADNNPVGAFITGEGAAPAQGGVRIYFGCDDIEAALTRAKDAGGKVVLEKMAIGPYGFIGQFADTEGNIVALHTPSG